MPSDASPAYQLPPSPADIEAALRAATPILPSRCVAFSFVLYVPNTDETTAYAVIDGKDFGRFAGTELDVKGWQTHVISEDCAIGHAVCCPPVRVGDCVTICLNGGASSEKIVAQVVSWNGSHVLTKDERDDGCQKQVERTAISREQTAQKRKHTAQRDKEDGIVAALRARRVASEAAWKKPRSG